MNRKKRTTRRGSSRPDPVLRRDRVADVLRGFAPDLKSGGRDMWTLNPRADAASHVTVRRRGSWLHFEMSALDRSQRTPWELLHAAGAGPGPGKAVLGSDGRSVHVRADVPAGLNGSLSDRCREGMASVRLLDALLRGHVREDAVAPAELRTNEPAAPPLIDLCAETGWSARERDDGTVSIDLETSRGVHRAEARTGPDGTTTIVVTLARFKALSEASREALGRFLLAAGRMVRLVRPMIREDEKRIAVAFEFRTCTPMAAGDVDEALIALATAAQEFGREAQALGDEALAVRYLENHESSRPNEQ